MRPLSTLTMAIVFACGACQPLPDGWPSAAQPVSAQPPATEPFCNSYTVPVTVGGQPQQAVVEACQQADGGWRITQTTPGLPSQVYEVPAQQYSPYPSAYTYPEAYPYADFSPYWGWDGWGWGGAPWFLGLAPSIVVVQRFNHFHHGFAHAHGFGRGFGRGFADGSGRGSAGMRGGGMAGGRR